MPVSHETAHGGAEISAVVEMRSLKNDQLKKRNSTPKMGLDTLPPTSKAHPARSGGKKSHNSLFQNTLDLSPFDSKTKRKNPARSMIPEDRGGRGRVLTRKQSPETPVSPIFRGQSYQIYFRVLQIGISQSQRPRTGVSAPHSVTSPRRGSAPHRLRGGRG